jgi:hypothetical protein
MTAGAPLIVLIGIASEPPVRLAAQAAQRAGLDALVVHQRRAADCDLRWEVSDPRAGMLVVDGREVPLGAIAGVYCRATDPTGLPEQRRGAPAERADRSAAFHAMLLEWVEQAPCRVANRAAAMASNSSKPYQGQLLAACGFELPPTLVTDDPEAVAAFAREHGRLVYKSTSSVRSIVREFDAAARGRLDRLPGLPTQFQRLEEGDDVRVHVIGGTVLAARARTTAVDYRYAGRDGVDLDLQPCEVPPEVADRCRLAARRLGLPFCGIDLRQRPDGSWVCFEANPSPGYSWYEEAAGLPISDALVRWLAHG